MRRVEIIPVEGIGEVGSGDDLVTLLMAGLSRSQVELVDGDVLVVTHKVISKAEGRTAKVADDESHRRVVEEQSAAVLRRRGDLIIARTRHGFICANAGVDRSNVAPGSAVLLPVDPDASAHRVRLGIEQVTGRKIAVVVTDTFGRSWRRGLVDVAIGISGVAAIIDLRGRTDSFGRELQVTEVAIVDEIAAAADLVMGKSRGIPAAVIRGLALPAADGRATDLVRPAGEDLFR